MGQTSRSGLAGRPWLRIFQGCQLGLQSPQNYNGIGFTSRQIYWLLVGFRRSTSNHAHVVSGRPQFPAHRGLSICSWRSCDTVYGFLVTQAARCMADGLLHSKGGERENARCKQWSSYSFMTSYHVWCVLFHRIESQFSQHREGDSHLFRGRVPQNLRTCL